MMPSARRLWSGAETAPPRPGRTAAPAALFPGLESVTEFSVTQTASLYTKVIIQLAGKACITDRAEQCASAMNSVVS